MVFKQVGKTVAPPRVAVSVSYSIDRHILLLVAAALIFVPRRDEKYYDFFGMLGFLSTTAISLYYPSLRAKFISENSVPIPPITSFASRHK